MKTLIVFYSLEGSTKKIGQELAKTLGAKILELKPEKEINKDSFMKIFWGGKQVLMKDRPPLKKWEISLSDFDLIVIGTPVWAFTFSPPIRSFLYQEKIKNKKVALYCCHEGGKGKTIENLKKELQNNTIVGEKDFKNVKKNETKVLKEAKEWAESLKRL